MICNYRIQCPDCHQIFEVDVDPEKVETYYPTKCPKCNKKIKIKLTKEKVRKPSRKVKDTGADEKITFKCVRIPDKDQPLSKLIRPVQFDHKPSKRTVLKDSKVSDDDFSAADVSFEVFPESGQVQPIEMEMQPEGTRHDAGIKRVGYGKAQPRRYRQQRERDLTKRTRKTPARKPGFYYTGKGLKVAQILLVIIFFLGIIHGALSIIMGVPAYSSSEDDVPDTVEISGVVIDFETGQPITDCIIRLIDTGQQTKTNNDGYYLLQNIAEGDRELEAEAKGYTKIIKKITVDIQLQRNFNFELKPGINVETVDETVQAIHEPENTVNTSAGFIILMACFALVSVILIRFKKMYKLSALTAFFAILSLGFGIGIILGIIALILILLSSPMFHSLKQNSSSRPMQTN